MDLEQTIEPVENKTKCFYSIVSIQMFSEWTIHVPIRDGWYTNPLENINPNDWRNTKLNGHVEGTLRKPYFKVNFWYVG